MCGRDGLGVGAGVCPQVCVWHLLVTLLGNPPTQAFIRGTRATLRRRVWWIQVSASVLASDLTSTTDPADIQEVTPVSGQFSGRIIGSLWEDGSLEEFVVTPDRRSDDQP